mgnify:CR=1 FL=1
MSSFTVLRASKLKKIYRQGGQEIRVLQDLDFELSVKDCVAIVGRSGSGKSTLLHALAGLDEVDSGTIEVLGVDLTQADSDERAQVRLKGMGFVYQAHHLLPEFSALENVAMPLRLRGIDRRQALLVAGEILEETGLIGRFDHRPNQLSGGERQRVAVARAVCPSPSIILADEPTGNLDFDSAVAVMDLLIGLTQSKDIALVVVTHDQSFLARFQKVYELSDGTLTEKIGE